MAIKPSCAICNGIGIINVIDVWRISRCRQKYGVGLPAFDTLPFVPGGAPCPECIGEDKYDDAIQEMKRKWGNPYDADSSSEENA